MDFKGFKRIISSITMYYSMNIGGQHPHHAERASKAQQHAVNSETKAS